MSSDSFDRVFGTGAPRPRPLDPKPTPGTPAKREPVWTTVPGKPYLEQSDETPPKLRTKPYHQGRP